MPDLSALTALTPLSGRLTIIHTSMLFYLFGTEDEQLRRARALAGLLAPTPGAMIFGWHVAEPEKGPMKSARFRNGDPITMFCHSVESWKEMWESEVFEKGAVEVRAELQPLEAPPGAVPTTINPWQLVWSVTRV